MPDNGSAPLLDQGTPRDAPVHKLGAASSFDAFRVLFDANSLAGAELAGVGLLDASPDQTIDVWMRLGLLRRRNKQTGTAIEAFLQAKQAAMASQRPLPDWFHSELSGAYAEQRAWPLALETAQAGLGVKPVLGLTIATALLHLEQLASARAQLQQTVQALALDPSRAAPVAAVCNALLAVDQGAAAQAVIAEAAAAFPASPDFAELRATLAFLRQDWDEAATRFALLFEAGAPAAALQRLNGMLRHAPAQASAYAALFEAAVLAAPDSEAALFQWRDLLAAMLPPAQVTDAFASLQARSTSVLPALMLQLARRMPHRELLQRFANPIEVWQRSGVVQACQAYLDALCRFEDLEPDALARVIAVPALQMRLFFLLRLPRLRVVQVRRPTPEDTALLREAGVDIVAVQAFLGGMVKGPSPEWAAYLDQAAFASPEAARIVRLDESFTAFQDRIVRDREFAMIDPFNGGAADLFDSVKIHDRQVFSFRGTGLVTFHTGGNMNFALFLYLVRSNILLLVDSPDARSKQNFYSADIYVSEVQAIWLARAARNHAALLHSAGEARAARGSARRIVAIHGRAENPAHHIWNYLPPFERLALAGTMAHLDTFVPPPTLYFGPLAGLFPELASVGDLTMAEAAAIDPCPFSPHAIALQLGGSFIPRTLVARVRGWAARQAPAGGPDGIARLSHRRPIIWIGLRVGDKMWINQTAGLAQVIDLVVPLYPGALFVLDGFSLPDHAATVPEKWHAAVLALQEIAAEVRRRTAHAGAVHSLVGNLLSESVLWAAAADVYLTPIGSSQHKVGWYGSAPGLVYTSTNLVKTAPEGRQGSWEAEGSAVPRFLIGAIAEPGLRRGNYDYRTNLENIDFEPHVAARRLVALLEGSEPSITA